LSVDWVGGALQSEGTQPWALEGSFSEKQRSVLHV
jgi:hypothetical protein